MRSAILNDFELHSGNVLSHNLVKLFLYKTFPITLEKVNKWSESNRN